MKSKGFKFICKYCNIEFVSKQSRERRFCSTSHFRLWSKGNINKKPISEEKKKKISKFWKNKVRGPNSLEHNKKISTARKGMKFSKQHKENMSISKVNKYFNNDIKPFFGKQQKYLSTKTNEVNHSHSSYELEVMKKLDKDDTIKYWTKNHKIKIQYLLNDSCHNYIPDFLVVYENNSREIIEVKGHIFNKEMFEAKKTACETFCNNNNIKYKVLFKEDIYEQTT